MEYGSNPLLIPLLATFYLTTIYVLLKIAENQLKKKPTSPSDVGNISS